MDVLSAYREVGTYRGAAKLCGVTPKTVKRIVEPDMVTTVRAQSASNNYEGVRALVTDKVKLSRGKISAKRLLPLGVATGYARSPRNFRRLVAQEKTAWRRANAVESRRRPAVWAAGEHVVIDWGVQAGPHVFCAVLAFSRVRFVRCADNERAAMSSAMSLPCVRFASARYSVPNRMIGAQVQLLADATTLTILTPGQASVVDAHYGSSRRATPARNVTPRTAAELAFCGLGPVAEQWLKSAAAAGDTRLGPELEQLADLLAAHGHDALRAALTRAVAFGRWRAADIRSILSAGSGVAQPQPPGEALVIELPASTSRPLEHYSLAALGGTSTAVSVGELR